MSCQQLYLVQQMCTQDNVPIKTNQKKKKPFWYKYYALLAS